MAARSFSIILTGLMAWLLFEAPCYTLSMAVVCYSGQIKSGSMLCADLCQGGVLDQDSEPDQDADPELSWELGADPDPVADPDSDADPYPVADPDPDPDDDPDMYVVPDPDADPERNADPDLGYYLGPD